MDTNQSEILEELSLEDVKNLVKMYENHRKQLPFIYSFLKNCVKALEGELPRFVTVYSPRSCWRKDGTFIASVPEPFPEIVFHTLDPSAKNLLEGFLHSKLLRTNFKTIKKYYAVLFGFHEQFHEKIRSVILNEVYDCNVVTFQECNLWSLDAEKGLKLDISCPEDVYVKKLEPKDLQIVIQHWPHTFDGADLMFLNRMKLCKGFGVHLKANNQLVSWVAPSCCGQMAALQTLEEHKKKGYASLVIKSMCKYLAEQGFDCCGTVFVGNIAAESVFAKLGFKILYKSIYLEVDKTKTK